MYLSTQSAELRRSETARGGAYPWNVDAPIRFISFHNHTFAFLFHLPELLQVCISLLPGQSATMSELKNQAQVVDYDVEKASSSSPSPQYENEKGPVGTLSKWNARIEGLSGFEARGLERVPESERQAPSKMGLLQMLLLWFSANITINNLAVGLLGPLVFELGFADSAMCAVIGVLLGSSTTSYMSIWGAASGNRTMVR